MKKLLLAAVAVSALVATPALAVAPDATYDVHATVNGLCSISAGSALTFTAALTDASVASNTGTTNEVDDTAAYCNQAGTKITISHDNLITPGTAGTGFTKEVNYTPVVTINGTGYNDVTDQLVGTFAGIKVKATSPSAVGATRLVAGDYTGNIYITLAPAN